MDRLSKKGLVKRLFTYRRIVLALFVAWSAAIGGLAWWYDADHTANLTEMARIYARACLEKDMIYRRWNAAHGGVYVTVSKDLQPNPYLQAAERDVITPSGRTLTLVNPAYMTRQVHELAANADNIPAHITSLKPLNPKNTPDKWEQEALLSFENGEKEVACVLKQDGKHTARLMRPFYVEQSCMKCHEQQGYKIGDVRGGISVTVPVDSVCKAQTQQARTVLVALGGIWMLGAVTIVLVGRATNRRRLEREQAIEALAHLAAIVNSSQDAIIGKTFDGNIISWNLGAEHLYGYTAEEVVGQSILILLPPNRTDELSLLLKKIKQKELVERYDTTRQRKDGSLVDVSLTLSPMTNFEGEIVGVATVAHDITDRKRAEQVLHESEERYRTLVENIDLGITLIDRQHRIVMVNEGQARMFKTTPRECVGQECFRLFEKREAVCLHCPGVTALNTGCPAEVETQGVRDDGRTIVVKIRAFPFYDSGGTPSGFIEVVEDITERKRTEEEISKARQAAEAANRSKSEFLANMSHEIRTPMTAILGFTDILLGNSLTEESAKAAEIIKRNGVHLLDLVNDILDLSKIEAGKCTLDVQKCSPSQIAAEVISLMKVPADAKGLPLSLEVQGSIPQEVTTDYIRVRQSLVNLIGNAIKFTEVGSVRVVMRLDSNSEGESKFVFDVIDTGIGMSAEQMSLLFRPFSQVHSSASRHFGGTGLGLAISKRMAEMLGGDIVIRSSPGEGSTFSFSIGIGRLDGLPLTQELSQTVTTSEPVSDVPQHLDCRILLAEDGPDNQRLIAFLLRNAGAEVELADNGRIALDHALAAKQAGNPFDLILMDIQMPVMDGYEATQKLRSAGFEQPIIALTAHAMTEARQKCIDAGCDDYMAKPVKRESLLTLVAKYAAVSSRSERPLCSSPMP